MKRIVSGMAAAVLAIALAGCATTGGSGGPCEACTYGYTPVKKSMERHAFCMVDGKKVDCTKNPADCPSCRK